MAEYRVVTVKNMFIPQMFESYTWYGLQENISGIFKFKAYSYAKWSSVELQLKYCSKKTLEEAKEVIKRHKQYIKENTIRVVASNV